MLQSPLQGIESARNTAVAIITNPETTAITEVISTYGQKALTSPYTRDNSAIAMTKPPTANTIVPDQVRTDSHRQSSTRLASLSSCPSDRVGFMKDATTLGREP